MAYATLNETDDSASTDTKVFFETKTLKHEFQGSHINSLFSVC